MIVSEMNSAVGSLLPAQVWDTAQIVLGSLMLLILFVQRAVNPRFQRAAMTCPLSTITVLVGQTGLVLWALLAGLLIIDAALPSIAPPRTVLVLMMTAFILEKLRLVHDLAVAAWRRRNAPSPDT
jgi:hypothetical protein